MKRTFFAMIPLLALAGCAGHESNALGAPPASSSIIAIRDLKSSGAPVMIRGVMVEKCPVAGCWFIVRDRTGTIKVDTKGAGFVVTDVPLNTTVTVTGRLKTSGERLITATGMRY
jgi:uncharacterized protein YdeI (BOF family)